MMDVEIDPVDFVLGSIDVAEQGVEGLSLRLLDFGSVHDRQQLEFRRTMKLGIEGTFSGRARTTKSVPRLGVVVLSYR
jgi:hypothetical protein